MLVFVSCEDVVDVDVSSEDPRLVIDASINWLKGTTGNEQQIKLTLSAPFFDATIPPANGATVVVTNSNNDEFIFIEDANTGIYRTSSFVPELDETYTLTINYADETYVGTETLQSVVPIDFIEQTNDGGFSGDDIEIKAYYTDPADAENYYFFEFDSSIPQIPVLEVYDDEFTNGNQIFGYYTEEELDTGDIVTIRNHGVSERFYNFMFVILQQSSDEDGGPFEVQPATVRGNCINTTRNK